MANIVDSTNEPSVVCSNCFRDAGLRLDAECLGLEIHGPCVNCGESGFKKLTQAGLRALAYRYFVWGSLWRTRFGAAPLIQFNEHQDTCINVQPWLEPDVRLIERILNVGFFPYGPRLWMIGEIEPLKALQRPRTRKNIVARILSEYPILKLTTGMSFYRVRINPRIPENAGQYDSPPSKLVGNGRLDSKGNPVLYGSPDLEVCIHECRVSAEDDTFVATLNTTQDLHLLDLSVLLEEGESVTEFESLDLTVHMLFLAGRHSYVLSRAIADAARFAGLDGVIYPSYFSLLRLGQMPFQTSYGISHRRFKQFQKFEQSKVIPNIAIFGYPIASGKVEVNSIDRLVINHVGYDYHFGPAGA